MFSLFSKIPIHITIFHANIIVCFSWYCFWCIHFWLPIHMPKQQVLEVATILRPTQFQIRGQIWACRFRLAQGLILACRFGWAHSQIWCMGLYPRTDPCHSSCPLDQKVGHHCFKLWNMPYLFLPLNSDLPSDKISIAISAVSPTLHLTHLPITFSPLSLRKV